MIIDKLISREDAYASGVEAGSEVSFAAGLEEAAQMHDRMAQNWSDCARDSTGIEAGLMRKRAIVHRCYATDIRNLKKEKE